ncbi:Protein GDAP2 homolog [Durusdinium trenchii]|uniref:Protein GDAP2 homolog n=1 Tax=Durusdinium trenchii TaxID=1381693 RepID=A0ABP0N9J2_9DINO
MLCLLGWMAIFYTPYAWSILNFNYEGGRQPGIVYTLVFSLIVCVGNLLMAEICSRVADAISFEFKDTRENCYMVLYLVAIAVNVALDLWTTYFMATQHHAWQASVAMDSVADAAGAVVRHSTMVIGAAAGEIARQANAVAQITSESDPIAWITGDDDDVIPDFVPLPPPIPDLVEELRHLDACRSGEARSCKAYGLPCQRLLLTVGPKYKEKYQVAAQNTLNSCYRECMQLLAESELKTVAIPCYWYSKGFPIEEQVHVALRSIRRCLEKLQASVDGVVLVAGNAAEFELFESLLPLYFPRTDLEAIHASSVLPESCWSEWGEVSMEERRIRVSNHLISEQSLEDGEDDADPLFGGEDDKSFLHARDDADSAAMRRLEGSMINATTTEEARHICIQYLRRAREIPSLNEPLRFVYQGGEDCFGRRVVVLLGARLPPLGLQDERTIALFVKELEALQNNNFLLLYVNSEVDSMDTSVLEVLQEMLAVIQAKYRSSLAQLLVLHPGLWFRAAFALGRAITDEAASVWHDSVYLESISELVSVLNASRLYLPDFVRYSEQQ